MIGKIHKFQLLFLFCLTIGSIFSFYFQDSIPDNYFYINSLGHSFNFLTFYSASVLVFIGYIFGPWVFVPFFIFTLLYSFLISKRNLWPDVLGVVPLTLGSLILGYWLIPEFLGEGIFQFIKDTFNLFDQIMLFFVSLFLFFFIFFRNISFLPRMIFGKIMEMNSWFSSKAQRPLNFSFFNTKIFQGFMPKLNLRLSFFLKGKEAEKDFSKSNHEKFKKGSKKEVLTDLKDRINSKKQKTLSKNEGDSDKKPYFELIKSLIKSFPDQKYSNQPSEEYFKEITERIENKLGEFKIDGGVINVLKGPVVDTFELELGPGVKVSKVNGHLQDLSMALYGSPIRIVYPMKGRTTMGIEVPRSPREVIYLKSILESENFSKDSSPLLIAMGQNAFGDIFIVDLASMPHMLVAGATGAGKSVFLNSLLVSLITKNTPKNLKLLLVDPKQLEFALYEGLPHLIMPVITESKKASLAFSWVIQEMERRYSILKELSVRNIDSFNSKIGAGISDEVRLKIKEFYNPTCDDYLLPYLVVVVDEFADLILSKNGKDIENNVCRLAAKARAAGIHLILATQRPSVDVITGLIKSNFPTRVSFKVSTSVDSRTILNAMGAEFLLGKGDMLFKSGIETSRVHSAFVDEKEIEFLLDGLKELPQNFDDRILDYLENENNVDSGHKRGMSGLVSGEETDELFDEALGIVMSHKLASASMLQRRLKIGYNRAANLIEEMESRGIVSKADGPRPRKILNNKIN
ncbi:DNA translocase FtsK [Bacteriovoracales bacterium]|nr:DNA translocase FtsK [Bacteriovoracales bacterium]